MNPYPPLPLDPVRGVTLRQQVVTGRIPDGPASGTGTNVRYVIHDGRMTFQSLLADRSTSTFLGEVTSVAEGQVLIRSVVVLGAAIVACVAPLGLFAMAVLIYLQTGAMLTLPAGSAVFIVVFCWRLWAREKRRAAVYHEEIRRLLAPAASAERR